MEEMTEYERAATRAMRIKTPTGRIVFDDKLGKAANERYKAFYQRQNFDLRFGHLFPVYPAKHTLMNTTALRVIGG